MANTNKVVNVPTAAKPRKKPAARVEQQVRRRSPVDDIATRSAENVPVGELTPNVETAVKTLMAEVDRLKQELVHSQQKVEELEFIADEDPLVHVLNRRAFDRELNRALAYARRYAMMASFIYLDLNDFKQVNDDYGHGAGDEVLKYVGKTLGENVRSSDVVGRLGGDEFGVILVQADAEVAKMKVEDLVTKIAARPVVHEGAEIFVSVSVGIAMFTADDDVASLVARADKAMYKNKSSSRIVQA